MHTYLSLLNFVELNTSVLKITISLSKSRVKLGSTDLKVSADEF